MITLTGNVTDRTGTPLVGAKVYASKENGDPVKDPNGDKVYTLTDSLGKYTLNIPQISIACFTTPCPQLAIANYITASASMLPKQTQKFSGSTNYNFVLGQVSAQEVAEATVSATRPKDEDENKKKLQLWHWLLIGGGALILIGTIAGIASKRGRK